jgi:hypothetical protein
MKKKFLVTFALCGLGIAMVLAAVRLYMFYTDPLSDALNEGGFIVFTLVLWPGAFYLGILKDAEPAKQIFFVYGVAVLLNGAIYGAVGWLVWRFARFMELVRPD